MTRAHAGVALVLCGLFACGNPPEEAPADSGTSDAGAPDAGPPDAGPFDAGACGVVTWSAPVGCDATAPIEARLSCVAGLTFTRVDAGIVGHARFNLEVTQQIDLHTDAGTFTQRAVLDYVSDDAPTVLFTSGYDLGAWPSELTQTYGTNQLSYEHRFFGSSRPSPADWSTLNIENAAADAHHLVDSLRWALPGRWLGTGGSKGGMTSLYHRRFHPCDVDGTVAYVAPMTQALEDEAYPEFIADAGGARWAACRADLTAFQRRILASRDTLVPQQPGSFTYLGADRAFEMAVVELPFAFWQYTPPDDLTYGCAAIPGASATPEAHLAFLQLQSPPDGLAGDEVLEYYVAYYYQAAAQLGGPAPFEEHLTDLLRFPGANATPTFLMVPGVPTPTFDDGAAMADIITWAQNDAERVLLISGEFDPWSAHPISVSSSRDSKSYTQAAGNHGSRIGTLSAEQRSEVLMTLTRWLGGRQVVNEPRILRPPPPERRFPR
jgi:hypothetical protein